MLDAMLGSIGQEIGKMHLAEIIHGDLTTSNMMVRIRNPSTSLGDEGTPFEVVRVHSSPLSLEYRPFPN